MDIRNKKISEAEFAALRSEVLTQWPTGKDVDLQEAVDYHKAMPKNRDFGTKLLEAKAAGRTLVQPRAGVPVIEEHIKLLQYLEQNDVMGEVVSLDVTDMGSVKMQYGDRFAIQMGDTTDLSYKIEVALAAISQLADHDRGTLDVSFIVRQEVIYTPQAD